jgi:RNA polymerase sigma factor (sigma-70 family)
VDSLDADDVWTLASSAFERWLDDDELALAELVAAMTPVLWHVVRAYRLDVELTEDVLQTTWLALVRSRGSVTESGAIGRWLTTTARREAWRVIKRRGRETTTDDEDLGYQLPAQRSAESAALVADERRRLWHAVESLPDRCQKLLRIVAFEHRPDYQAVADTLQMPVGSIGPTRGRCLEKLRVVLADQDEERAHDAVEALRDTRPHQVEAQR